MTTQEINEYLKQYPPAGWKDSFCCCQSCGRNYNADYRQDRDYSRCPVCTGEIGKRVLTVYHVEERRTYVWNESTQTYEPTR